MRCVPDDVSIAGLWRLEQARIQTDAVSWLESVVWLCVLLVRDGCSKTRCCAVQRLGMRNRFWRNALMARHILAGIALPLIGE